MVQGLGLSERRLRIGSRQGLPLNVRPRWIIEEAGEAKFDFGSPRQCGEVGDAHFLYTHRCKRAVRELASSPIQEAQSL